MVHRGNIYLKNVRKCAKASAKSERRCRKVDRRDEKMEKEAPSVMLSKLAVLG